MWYEFLIEGLKKFAGEIIGIILITVVLSFFPGLRNLFTKYKKLKKDDNDDTDVREALKNIQKLEDFTSDIFPMEEGREVTLRKGVRSASSCGEKE